MRSLFHLVSLPFYTLQKFYLESCLDDEHKILLPNHAFKINIISSFSQLYLLQSLASKAELLGTSSEAKLTLSDYV